MQTKTLGIGIIIIGVLITVYNGFNYITSKKVAEIGSVQINRETNHRIPISPIVGIVFIVGGLVILVKGKSN